MVERKMSHFDLNALKEQGILSSLDVHFARFMATLSKNNDPLFAWSAALVSNWTARGHICVDLPQLADKPLPIDTDIIMSPCPSLDAWKSALQATVIGKEGEFAPLILDQKNRLYLYRYWEYQHKLAQALQSRLEKPVEIHFPHRLKEQLESLFPHSLETVDWQKIAALVAILKSFCVIAGGPGTGKTSTVVKILALLQMQSEKALQIALVAPTGKAAMRLRQSIISAKKQLPSAQNVPEETSTIHRFLHPLPDSPYFHFNEARKIQVDVVVVDEASMVDLALMSKLVQALPSSSRLILLGDKDQLASVEAGAVLGDLCEGVAHGFSAHFQHQLSPFIPEINHLPVLSTTIPMQDAAVLLKHSYRFDSQNKIGRLAQAVNQGNADQAIDILKETGNEVIWLEKADDWQHYAQQGYQPYLQPIDNPQQTLEAFQRFRVLCAHRQGHWGVSYLNQQIEQLLGFSKQYQHYAHRPVMITQNSYGLRLFNGDTGIILADKSKLWAWFENTDGGYRQLPAARLPVHETAFVMTIHKSQGSEFEEVLLLLPDKPSPILTRELLYTGITRTKQRLILVGGEEILRLAISTRIQRSSGLHAALF
ncbi:MAG: hypothetical protein RIT27_1153 [Pseudomonadota bacterium]|jgi:exodeoxyribonuclease V alpha subunit